MISNPNLSELSEQEREQLSKSVESLSDTEGETELSLEDKQLEEKLTKSATDDGHEPYIVEFDYKDDKTIAVPDDKTQSGEPVFKPETDLGGGTKDELFQKFKERYPEYAELNSFDEVLGKGRVTSNEPTLAEQVNLPSSEQEEQLILSKTYQEASQDNVIQNALSQAGFSRIPQTLDEWKELHNTDAFLYTTIVNRFHQFKDKITETYEHVKETYVKAPEINYTKAKEFVGKVEAKVLSLNPKISPTDVSYLKTKVKAFIEKSINNSEFYRQENGVPLLDSDLLYSRFIVDNFDDLTKLSVVGQSSVQQNKAEQLIEQMKKGKSQTTLANSGISSGKKVARDVRSQQGQNELTTKELNSLMAQFDKEIAQSGNIED